VRRATKVAGTIAVLVAAVTAPLFANPAKAAAPPIKECGAFSMPEYDFAVWKVTTRRVSCWAARPRVYRHVNLIGETVGNPYWSPYLRMWCRWHRYARAKWDTRCVNGGKVVRFQHGTA
jgi:hypothetical protein